MSPPTNAPPVIAKRYRLEKRLGRGGMGEVFHAWDETEKRAVALKRMYPYSSEDPTIAKLRFRREFHTLASLRHPRIVSVYDFGTDDDVSFYTMELLDGVDLKDLGLVAPREACRLLRDVAGALAMLHARGLVHRDLAAKNVRRLESGRAKLMDFGILANVGVAAEMAGTAAYMAPETMRDMPIDGRTDLYALGVLAYVLMSERLPYPARSFEEVALAWQRAPPPPPSAYAKDIPPALDALVMTLIAYEPAARPSSAAEVMTRLAGIGGLEVDAEMEVPRGYVASAPLVGRERELEHVRSAVERASRGKGGSLFIRAESGTGKTRLMREVMLEAKLGGAKTASVSCETAAPSPFSTMDAIADALFRAAPGDAKDTLAPFAGVLARVLSSVREQVPDAPAKLRSEEPSEERLRVQRALADWILALAAKVPLCLLVDDIQRCDEASAAALAALAREARSAKLLVVAAQRTGEDVRAPSAVATLKKDSKLIELAGLSEESMKELVDALFGAPPNAARLARHLFEATGGSPMHATELMRQLVDDGTVRYSEGLWVISGDLASSGAPKTLAEAMDQRVRGLTVEARRLGEVLAVAGGTPSLDLVADFAEGGGEIVHESSGRLVDRTFAALDELTEKGVLQGDGERFRFRHDSAREAFLRAMDDERKRALHRTVGARLAEEADAEERAAEVGFHLLEGGAERAGSDLLAKAGLALFDAQALADCIAPLEAALACRERLGDPRGKTMELRAMLLAAGWVSDRAVGSKHALRVVQEYRAQSGIAIAERLRFFGRPLALALGIALATIAWVFRGSTRGPSPMRCILTFAISVSYALGLANAENRKADLAELVPLVDPFGTLRSRVPYAVYLVSRSFPDILYGRLGSASRRLTRALEIFQTDRPSVATETERRFAEAGVRGLRVLVDVNQLDPRVHEDCAAIDALGFRYYRLVVQATKVVYHRYRGEEGKALAIERAMEIPSIQLGSWSTDIQILMFAHPAYAITRDVLGLERCIAAFERLIPRGFHYETRLAITRADWHRERGDPAEGVRVLERCIAALEPEDFLMRQWGGSSLAECLLAVGHAEDARVEAESILALAKDPDAAIVLPQLRARRVLGLALEELGQPEEARRVLREAIAACEAVDCAPLAGAMHEARARIALRENDRETYRFHATEMLRWLRPTENAALLGFAERLLEAGMASGDPTDASQTEGPTMIDTAIDQPSVRSSGSGSGTG
ncbi:hypothetical protein BH09MYX1_BH09MYX1_58600 [soil metagenome]